MMASPVAIMGAWWQIMEAGRFSMASRDTSQVIVWGTLTLPWQRKYLSRSAVTPTIVLAHDGLSASWRVWP